MEKAMTEPIPHILVVDDELSMREFLEVMLSRSGYQVTTAENGQAALSFLSEGTYDLLLCDIRLGDMTGLDVLKAAKAQNPDATVILISAYATTETAVEAMNAGAYDYLPKPFANKELLATIQNALSMRTLEQERVVMADTVKKTLHFGRIIGNSPAMQKIFDRVHQVAKTRTSVLITGESGTGKELLAHSIHDVSDRKEKPFVVVNCGSIPETLMESSFFGHKKGAFTGATQDQKGFFEAASGGTVFLDEISELPLQLQVKLLRAVQERKVLPVGGTNEVPVDFRIISAANKNLEEEVIAGRFREDLFYRLNVVEIRIPSLRERKEDLRILAQHFLDKYAKEMGKEVTKLSSYAIDLLQRYDFPGNVRELENLIERSVALSSTNIILPESLSLSLHKRRRLGQSDTTAESPGIPSVFSSPQSPVSPVLPPPAASGKAPAAPLTASPFAGIRHPKATGEDVASGVRLDTILETLEKSYLEQSLAVTGGSKQKAAGLLGISFRSFRYRLRKYGID